MDKQTIDAYNNFAQKYDEETSDFWDKFPQTFLKRFIGSIKGEKKVLDIGSGPGRDGLILQQAGMQVVCLDASEAMIKLSQSKGLNSIKADFNQLPFEDNFFDGIWAYTSLLHVPKSEISKPMQEIRRVLKPNGIFGLGLIEGTVEEYRETKKVSEPRWFSFYTKNEVENLLRQYKFEILHFEEFRPNTKNYLNFISEKLA